MFGAFPFAAAEFAASPTDLPAVVTHTLAPLNVATQGAASAQGGPQTALAIGSETAQVLGALDQNRATSF